MESDNVYELNFSKQAFVEPYYLTNRSIQLYDETIITWGYDKGAQVYDMREVGYKLKVLPDAYMVHLSHNDIKGYKKWNTNLDNNSPRSRLKKGTADNRREVFPGLFTNTYYPEWLEDSSFCLKEEINRISALHDEIYLTKKAVAFYRTMLYVLMACFAVVLLVVLHKKDT